VPTLHYWLQTYVQTVVVAFVLSAVLTPLAIWILGRLGAVDKVTDGKLHARPTPRGGGVVIFIAFAVAVLLPDYRDNPMKGVVLGSFICLLVGIADDIRGGVPAMLKVIILIAVTVLMSRFGVQLRLFGWQPLDLAVTILWMVGVTSAFNGLDNMDGLASGVAAIVASMFFVIALEAFVVSGTENSLSWFGLLSAGLIGANVGFLLYNFWPAHIFMGDAGSFFLGFMLAALGVMGDWADNRVIAGLIPVIILGVPLFDFAYILIARIVRGETRTLRAVIEHCALDHLSHRLCWIGLSQRRAVFVIYLIAAAMGVTGILLRNSSTIMDMILAILQALTILGIVILLMAAAARQQKAFIRQQANRMSHELEGDTDGKHQMAAEITKARSLVERLDPRQHHR
jgi:UDP-GlcNAc:undecaprenyl-phosphate/decaprenyl-phosphate GlcNAc-1-phosphate transferase